MQENSLKVIQIRKETENCLFLVNIIFYVENPKDSTNESQEILIQQCHSIKYQLYFFFLLINNWKIKFKIIPFSKI